MRSWLEDGKEAGRKKKQLGLGWSENKQKAAAESIDRLPTAAWQNKQGRAGKKDRAKKLRKLQNRGRDAVKMAVLVAKGELGEGGKNWHR